MMTERNGSRTAQGVNIHTEHPGPTTLTAVTDSTPTRRPLRLTLAALLVAQALLVVHPVHAVSNYFVGAGVAGKGLAFVHVLDVVLQGFGYLVTPFVVVLLLLAAWGVAHRARGVGALLLQPIVAGYVLVPFLRAFGTADARLLGAITVLTAVLLITLIARTDTAASTHRRWWLLVGFAVGAVVIAAIGGASQALPFDPVRALTGDGTGQARAGQDVPVPQAPQNPALAQNPFNSIHNDSWGTDAYELPTPSDPRGAPVESLFTGGDCATMTFDSQGRLITLCSTLTRVVAYIVDPDTLEVLDKKIVGDRRPRLTDFSGGGYFILDNQDRIVFPARGGTLRILSTVDGLQDVDNIDVSTTLEPDEQVTSVMPDWDGRYWYVGSLGTVGVIRDGRVAALNLGGEDIEHSFAVARDAVYVVSGAALYRLEAQDGGPPRIVWRTEYDRGTMRKPGQTSRASGTTPTVFGQWVAITDNAEPRMNVLVADTETGEVTCRQPVFGDGASATDNALIAINNHLVVENNYGYRPAVTSTTAGRSTTPGMAAVSVDPVTGACALAWENDQVYVPSVVSKGTGIGGLIITYTKPPNPIGADAWYFTAVDVRTGEVVWTRRAGAGTSFNNHYAAAYLGQDGDFYVGTINGIVVLRNGAQ